MARLARFSSALGPGSLTVMIDHPEQLASVAAIAQESGNPPHIFVKIDAHYGRAGVVADSPACSELLDAVLAAEEAGDCVLHGLYCHAGHSYGTRDNWAAMHLLALEYAQLSGVAALVRHKSPGHPLVLSVGASPTATTIQHPNFFGAAAESDAPVQEVMKHLTDLKQAGFELEVHAGV